MLCRGVSETIALMHELPALSIQQLWAWAILYAGKDVENRTWRTSRRGPFLIHAGLRADPDFTLDQAQADLCRRIPPDQVHYGGIVGTAEIVDCVDHLSSVWFCGPHGFILRNARVLPFVPCKGRLGFFRAEPKGEA